MNRVTENVIYVGVNDYDIDLFEGQYPVPEGMSYNSYVLLDERIAVMDTVDGRKTAQWLANVEQALHGRKPDYLIVQHMEPDHSASIDAFWRRYPDVIVVGNARTFMMLGQFFPKLKVCTTCNATADDAESAREGVRALTVKDGEQLRLGRHALQFLFAPMVHWPEVMMTYEASEKILFSADAFGRFGALKTVQQRCPEDHWTGEAARYYFGIVGKYGAQVQAVLKKAAALDIGKICPLHGPILEGNLRHYLEKYHIWSSYEPEKIGVCICYSSIYGHTAEAVHLLTELLQEAGEELVCYDLARCDMSEAVKNAFLYDRLVVVSVTYNGSIFPHMKTFLNALEERGFCRRRVGFMENGSWAPMANKIMQNTIQNWKNITFIEPTVTIRSAVNEEAAAQIKALAAALRVTEETGGSASDGARCRAGSA